MRFPAYHPPIALLLVLVSVLHASAALAGSEPTPSELSVARRLFDEGKAAEDAARWREAADKFRRATAIKDTPGMRFHLARCQEEQGQLVEALVEYDRARELIDGGMRAADVEKLLATARERVRAKVALLTLRLPTDVRNVSVELDGKALSASVLDVPMPINPGKHRLRAVSVGRTPFAQELALGTGEVRELPIELPVATTVPPTQPPVAASPPLLRPEVTRDDPSVPTRTIVLVGEASLFAAGLATGIGFSVARSAANERYRNANQTVLESVMGMDDEGNACSTPRLGCAELDQARRDRDRAGAYALGGYVAAGVSAAAFGLTYWLWPRQQAVGVRAAAAPGRTEFAISGRF